MTLSEAAVPGYNDAGCNWHAADCARCRSVRRPAGPRCRRFGFLRGGHAASDYGSVECQPIRGWQGTSRRCAANLRTART